MQFGMISDDEHSWTVHGARARALTLTHTEFIHHSTQIGHTRTPSAQPSRGATVTALGHGASGPPFFSRSQRGSLRARPASSRMRGGASLLLEAGDSLADCLRVPHDSRLGQHLAVMDVEGLG